MQYFRAVALLGSLIQLLGLWDVFRRSPEKEQDVLVLVQGVLDVIQPRLALFSPRGLTPAKVNAVREALVGLVKAVLAVRRG